VKEITQLAAELGRRLQLLNAHVTTAESCTGGGIAEAITRIPGQFGLVRGGLRHLFQPAEDPQLNVPADLFGTVGAVSRRWSRRWSAARRKSLARFAVAVSGVAGPDGGSPNKPVGTVAGVGRGRAVSSEAALPRQPRRGAPTNGEGRARGAVATAAREIENQG
jgi:nicotinamide-nucleotide amidase